MKSKLIGVGDWVPYGETMWSIVHKLSIRNHFDWKEFKQTFGKSINSFNPNTKYGMIPDHSENFDIEKFSLLTGWNEEVLLTNFSNYYSPIWLNKVPLDTKFKYCPDCIKGGLHLVFHQMADFKLCPIHQVELTWLKGGTSSNSYNFQITREAFKEWNDTNDIRHCSKHSGHDHANSNVKVLELLIKDYKEWLSDIENLVMNDKEMFLFKPSFSCENKIWCNQREEYIDLMIMNELISAPDWLQKSLFNNRKPINTARQFTQGKITFPSCSDNLKHLVKLEGYHEYQGGLFEKFVRNNTLEEAEKLFSLCFSSLDQITSTYKNKDCDVGVFFSSFNYSQLGTGERNSAWNTALYLLSLLFKEMTMLFNNSQTDYLGRTYKLLINNPIWNMWIMGPGKLMTISTKQSQAMYFNNRKFLDWLMPIWVKQTIYEIYYWIVALVCFTCSKRLDGLITSDFSLYNLQVINAKYPVWLIEKESNKKVVVQEYSMIASHEEFVSLKRSGFRGIDDDLFTDFENLRPLIDLLNMDQKCVEEWKGLWEYNSKNIKENNVIEWTNLWGTTIKSVRKTSKYTIQL